MEKYNKFIKYSLLLHLITFLSFVTMIIRPIHVLIIGPFIISCALINTFLLYLLYLLPKQNNGGRLMNELIKEEQKKLLSYLDKVVTASNIVLRPRIKDIVILPEYKQYKKTLKIVYETNKNAYINIDMNSNLATARVLNHYLFNGNCCGFIEVEYL